MGSLVLENIEKSFEGESACSDINLTINKGEFFTFLGPSGCGKTTILRLIAGFIKPDNGRIFIREKEITQLAPEKRKVGMVFQNYALFPFMTVLENVEYGLKIKRRSKKEIVIKTEKYIDMVGLCGYEKRNVSDLSGGEQQRVALARSLATEPQVLLLDEPLSNLDARLRDRMRSELKSLQKELGITTVFVTHDQTEALTMSDKIAVFDKGRCIQAGSPSEIYSEPVNSFVAKFIGDTNLFKIRSDGQNICISENLCIQSDNKKKGKYISIRPQDIKITKHGPEELNTFHGVVEDIQLNGMWIDYYVRVGDCSFRSTVLNTFESNLNVNAGDEVYLSFKNDSIKILDN